MRDLLLPRLLGALAGAGVALAGVGVALAGAGVARAADEPEAKPPKPWTNSTELSLLVTEGNSDVQTFGFKDTLEFKTRHGRTRLRIDSYRSDTSDDPYLLVQPGLTFPPGDTISTYSTTAVRPSAEPDAERYFVEGRYEGNLPIEATWSSGASWDRNEDAGILNRTIVFAALGRVWVEREDRTFRTSYGLSFTDREEEVPDPEKEERFAGFRLSSDFMDKWGKSTTFDFDLTANLSLEDSSDYTFDVVQGLSVSMNKWLSLKVGLQFLYASEPALEDVDVIARVRVVDPDGTPGTGDEFFETVDSGGSEITIGEDRLRKEQLDTVFRTSLLISF
jgi:putative salt-induced outer membrane protein YdiY